MVSVTAQAQTVERAQAEQVRAEPTYQQLRQFMDAGRTQLEAAEHFGLSRQRVQRVLAAGADRRGETERRVSELVEGWDHDPARAVHAQVLVALARVIDRSSTSTTAAAAVAAVQAATELRRALADLDAAGREDRQWLLSVFAAPGNFDMEGGAE
jgi:DNA-binding transcriptional regulator LsrR (DeoR family)